MIRNEREMQNKSKTFLIFPFGYTDVRSPQTLYFVTQLNFILWIKNGGISNLFTNVRLYEHVMIYEKENAVMFFNLLK